MLLKECQIGLRVILIWLGERLFKPKIPSQILKGRFYLVRFFDPDLKVSVFGKEDGSLLLRFDEETTAYGPEGISVTFPKNSLLEIYWPSLRYISEADECFIKSVVKIALYRVESIERHPLDSSHFILLVQ